MKEIMQRCRAIVDEIFADPARPNHVLLCPQLFQEALANLRNYSREEYQTGRRTVVCDQWQKEFTGGVRNYNDVLVRSGAPLENGDNAGAFSSTYLRLMTRQARGEDFVATVIQVRRLFARE